MSNRTIGEDELARIDAMTEEDIQAGIARDPDAREMTPEECARLQRRTRVKRVRQTMRLSQVQFCERFGIPLETLRDWEQRRHAPTGAAESLIYAIEYHPEAVADAVKRGRESAQSA